MSKFDQMKRYILLGITLLSALTAVSQKKYFTRNGHVSFQAGTAMEDIDAVNSAAGSVFDIGTGKIEFAVLIKGFEFKRALMQEHFNENYMESDKYPKSFFKGTIVDAGKINLGKDGVYPISVKGTLEMHGIKREVSAAGTFEITGNGAVVNASAGFSILLSDYNIAIPKLVKDKISGSAAIKVSCVYNELK